MNKRGQLNPRSNVKLDNAPKSHPPIVLIAAISFLIILILIGILISIKLISFEDGKLILGKSYDLTLKDAYIDGADVNVIVGRGSAKGNLTGVKFTFSKGEDSISIERYVTLGDGEERIFSFTSSEIPGITGYEKVSVAPIYLSDNGERILGKVDDSRKISDTPSGGGGGGGGSSGGGSGGTSGDTGTPGTEEDFVLLSSSSGNNLETDDLIATPQNLGTYNTLIYDWRRNGDSVAVVNVPFDTPIDPTYTTLVKDYSSYGNNGILGAGNQTEMPTWTSNGISGGAYVFDGVDDYIDLGNDSSLDFTGDFTILLWFNSRAWSDSIATFISKRDTFGGMDWELYHSTASRVHFYYGNSAANQLFKTLNVEPSLNAWHQMAVTREGNNFSLWLDGQYRGSETSSGVMPTGDRVRIGKFGTTASQSANSKFNGSIDEVRLYAGSLSGSQISSMYNNGIPRHNIIVSQETTPGENWTVSVTPNDGSDDAETLLSNWIIVAQPGGDTIAPQRSNGAPSGTLSSGTSQATISLTTNENAVCRYSTSPGTSYQSMSAFSNTGGTTHSFIKTGLSNGVAYNYYVKCNDNSGNSNTDDYIISFSVDSGRTGGQGLLFYDGFESGDFSGWPGDEYCCSHSLAVVQSPARAGSYAARFEIRREDPLVNTGNRAEVKLTHSTTGRTTGGVGDERWYGLSIFIPSDWNSTPPQLSEILAQWHAYPDFDLGETWRNPQLAIRIIEDQWAITNVWGPEAIVNLSNRRWEQLWTGPLTKGVWTDWVVHAYWSYEADGVLEVWKDGVKVVNKLGGNAFNDTSPLYFKMGIYNWDWKNGLNISPVTTRVAYHDEVRIADGSGSYADVDPSGVDTRQKVLFKADDLKCCPPTNWVRFVDLINNYSAAAGLGIVGNSLESGNSNYLSFLSGVVADPNIELWNHGYDHVCTDASNFWEFKNSGYTHQKDHLRLTNDLVKQNLGFTLRAFGAPCNHIDDDTLRVINEDPEVDVWIFGDTRSNKTVLSRTINVEYPIFYPNASQFIANYDETRPYLALQMHPANWDDARFNEFEQILQFLSGKNVNFVVPSEFLA